MLGEIALYSFIILLLTGTFLTLFFEPSMTEVDLPRAPTSRCTALTMSEAYASTLQTLASTSAAACSCGRSTTGPR